MCLRTLIPIFNFIFYIYFIFNWLNTPLDHISNHEILDSGMDVYVVSEVLHVGTDET